MRWLDNELRMDLGTATQRRCDLIYNHSIRIEVDLMEILNLAFFELYFL